MADDLESLVYRHISRSGPTTAGAIVAALGEDAERVSATMSRLLDAHRLVVAGVTPDGEPLYAVAADRNGHPPASSPPPLENSSQSN